MSKPGYRKIAGKWVKPVAGSYKKKEFSTRHHPNWVSVTIRAEHFVMLRELADFHKCTASAAAMALIQDEFIRQLAVSDPEKARQLEEEYGPLYKNA